jgi:DNA polymerase III alpha subunit
MYLNCHSYFSLRYGTIPIDDLVELGVQCNAKAMALTDINCVTGIYDFVLECRANNIKPLVGVEFRNGNELRFIGLAKSAKGIGEMCRLLTKHNFERSQLSQFADFNDTIVIYPLENVPLILKENEYIGLRPEQLIRLYKPELKAKMDKIVILSPVTFRVRDEFNLHRILRAIDQNVIFSKLTEQDICKRTEVMAPVAELIAHYKDYPKILRNTEKIIENCNYDFDFKAPKNKKYYTNDRFSDRELLTSLALEGMQRRYGANNREAIARVNKELVLLAIF